MNLRAPTREESEGRIAPGAEHPEQRRLGWRRPRLWATVAALACTAAIAGLGAGGLVLGGDGEQTVPMRSEIRQASAELEIGADNTSLVASRLPPPPADEAYMVWIQRPGEGPEPTSALFVPRGDGSATASVPGDLEGVEAVLVNTEPLAGDATTPTSAPVLVATLT